MYNSNNNNNNKSLDPNYDIVKNEFNNLYEYSNNLNDSITNYCNSIKDIYLNPTSFLNNLSVIYNEGSEQQHPLSMYSSNIKLQIESIISGWSYDQENNLNSILNYCQFLNTIKANIDNVDTLEYNLVNYQQQNQQQQQQQEQEYINEKVNLFNDVNLVFQDRVNSFDIPIINLQFSIQSLFQSLNSVYYDSTYLLEYSLPENVNPVQHLKFIQPQQEQIQPQQSLSKPAAFTLKKRPTSTYGGVAPVGIQQQQDNQQIKTQQQPQPIQSQQPPLKPAPFVLKKRPISTIGGIAPVGIQQQQDSQSSATEIQQQQPIQSPSKPAPFVLKKRPISTVGGIAPVGIQQEQQTTTADSPASLSSNPLFNKSQQQNQSPPPPNTLQQPPLKPRSFSVSGNGPPIQQQEVQQPLKPAVFSLKKRPTPIYGGVAPVGIQQQQQDNQTSATTADSPASLSSNSLFNKLQQQNQSSPPPNTNTSQQPPLKPRSLSVFGGTPPLKQQSPPEQLQQSTDSSSPLKPSPVVLKKRPSSIYSGVTPQSLDNQQIAAADTQQPPIKPSPVVLKKRPSSIYGGSAPQSVDNQQQVAETTTNVPPASLSSNPLFNKLQQQNQESSPQQPLPQPQLKPRPLSTYGSIPPINTTTTNSEVTDVSDDQPDFKPRRPAPIPKELLQQQQTQPPQQTKPPLFKPAITSQNQAQPDFKPTRPAPPPKINDEPQQQPQQLQKQLPTPPIKPTFKQPPSYSPLVTNNQINGNNTPTYLTYSRINHNFMTISKIQGKEIISQSPTNSYYKYSKSREPWIQPKNTTGPPLDQLMFDHETHKRMFHRRFKVTRDYQFSVRYSMKTTYSYDKGYLTKFLAYIHKVQSIQSQNVTSCTYELHCEVTGKICQSTEIPTNLYSCFKVEHSCIPTNSECIFSLVHVTEADMYSNSLVEVDENEPVEYTPITDQEIFIYTKSDEQCNHDTPEFTAFIKQYKLEPIQFSDGSKESIICFCYRVSLFIKKHITYDVNYGTQQPLVCFQNRKGACGSYSFLFASIARYNNIPTRALSGISVEKEAFVFDRSTGKTIANDVGRHQQVEFYFEGLWISYNGAFNDCYTYNLNAFGPSGKVTFVQQLNYTTHTEFSKETDYPVISKYYSLTCPRTSNRHSNKVTNKTKEPIETSSMEITRQKQ